METHYRKVLDELLDKINQEGYESLSGSEKEMLKKASEYLDKKKNKNKN